MRCNGEGRRVLIIVENLPVPLDRRVWQESQSLLAAGYVPTVLCPRMKGYAVRHEVLDGIRIYRHPMPKEARGLLQYCIEYPVALFWEIVYTFFIFMRHGFDVIQVCNPPDLLFLAAAPYRILAGRRLIFDFHDSSPEIWAAKGNKRSGAIYRILLALEMISLRFADVTMTVNDPYKAMVVSRARIAGDKVSVVRNSPRLPKSSATQAGGHRRGDGIIVGYVGVLGKQDGVQNLLETFAYIVNERGRRDITLKVMGTGPEYKPIEAMRRELRLEDNVVLTGWVSGQDYINHMSACDICVNADMVNDYNNLCSPNKVYEYMFFSKPIVQFMMAESSFQAEGSCLFARPNDYRHLGDRIIDLADDEELRIRLGTNGKRRFHELFTWERAEAVLLETYRKVLE